jgi:hypothetical protein
MTPKQFQEEYCFSDSTMELIKRWVKMFDGKVVQVYETPNKDSK